MKRPWLKFYPADWRSEPRLRMCSLAARGLWIDLISYMHEGEPYGYLTVNGNKPTMEQIASLLGRPIKEVKGAFDELISLGVCSSDGGTIVSRRMVRDKAKDDKNQEDGVAGGNPLLRRGTVPKDQRVRPYRRSDAPEKTNRIFDRNGGKCHWCGVTLVRSFDPSGPLPPNYFHVDHVIPVCDGGTNDESNLVAACADCNHKRARIDGPTSRQLSVGNGSDVIVGFAPTIKPRC